MLVVGEATIGERVTQHSRNLLAIGIRGTHAQGSGHRIVRLHRLDLSLTHVVRLSDASGRAA